LLPETAQASSTCAAVSVLLLLVLLPVAALNLWMLCRYRHNIHNAATGIMPRRT
jgi:hypothetical protein